MALRRPMRSARNPKNWNPKNIPAYMTSEKSAIMVRLSPRSRVRKVGIQ